MSRLHWVVVGALGAGLVALFVLGWRFAIHPLEMDREAKIAEKGNLEAKLKEAKDRAAQYEKFQAEAENVRRDLEFYSRRLDEPMDREQVYGTLESLIGSQSIRLTKGEVETKVNPKGGELHSVTLEMDCDLERLGRMLNDCVSQQHLFVINTLEMTRFDDLAQDYRDTIKVKLAMDVISGARGPK
jgi:Tfp pilus assembly protein PilO